MNYIDQAIERQFDYRQPTGMLKLLGVLMVILGPLTFWMSFQEGGPDSLSFRGRLWLDISGPAVPWVLRLMGVVMVYVGVVVVKAMIRQDRTGGHIAFTPHAIIVAVDQTNSPGGLIHFKDITNIATSEKKGREILTFTYSGKTITVGSNEMRSRQEFDEMCSVLKDRVNASALSTESVSA